MEKLEKKAWLVGQAVKTSPSHGENSGSIPLRAVIKKNTLDYSKVFFLNLWGFFLLFFLSV